MLIDLAHIEAIRIAAVKANAAISSGMSPAAEAFVVLEAIAALQADLRIVLESERRRELMRIAN